MPKTFNTFTDKLYGCNMNTVVRNNIVIFICKLKVDVLCMKIQTLTKLVYKKIRKKVHRL